MAAKPLSESSQNSNKGKLSGAWRSVDEVATGGSKLGSTIKN
jgi:hypothetical protein